MKLSLAGWSLVKLFRNQEESLSLLDFPTFTKDTFGIDAVELNNVFFESKEPAYLARLSAAASSAGVKLLNIAVDEEGDLSADVQSERDEGLAAYGGWIPVARQLGIDTIRVNSGGKVATDAATAERHCVHSLRRLCELGKKHDVAVIIENHGGVSADPHALARVISAVRQSHGVGATGTLADFGNWSDAVDKYDALRTIMPFARAVHAKVLAIDENLDHPAFDLDRCVRIAREAGYDGYLGIESEGKQAGQVESVKRAVRKLSRLL